MRSMTGYGRAMGDLDGRQLTIEVKSVNHRFLDISFRMPRTLMFLEDDARKLIASKLARGHVDVFMTYRNQRSDAKSVTVDHALFDAYASALSELAMNYIAPGGSVRDDRSIMNIARFPDVVVVTEAEEDQDALRKLMRDTLSAALDQLVAMRTREGAEMKRDLSARAGRIEEMTRAIEARYPDTVKEYTARLRASSSLQRKGVLRESASMSAIVKSTSASCATAKR